MKDEDRQALKNILSGYATDDVAYNLSNIAMEIANDTSDDGPTKVKAAELKNFAEASSGFVGKVIWCNIDPRYELVGRKRAKIVMSIPCGSCTADIEMKHGWSIITDWDLHKSIDKWDQDWYWTLAPDTY